ncbi:MAG: hypothetical protein IJN42_00675, partial [Clostridia bacterium]|nr:hypothetical protein [Clostridia bacterium]
YKRVKATFSGQGNVKVAVLRKTGKILAVGYHGTKDFFGRLEHSYYDISDFEKGNSTDSL